MSVCAERGLLARHCPMSRGEQARLVRLEVRSCLMLRPLCPPVFSALPNPNPTLPPAPIRRALCCIRRSVSQSNANHGFSCRWYGPINHNTHSLAPASRTNAALWLATTTTTRLDSTRHQQMKGTPTPWQPQPWVLQALALWQAAAWRMTRVLQRCRHQRRRPLRRAGVPLATLWRSW